MELKQVIKVVKSRIWLILVFVLLGTSAVSAFSMYFIKPVYEASANLILTRSGQEIDSRLIDYNTLLANGMLIETYRDIVKMSGFMEKVVAAHPQFGLTTKELISLVKVNSSNNQIMSIVVRYSSYDRAAEIANAVSGAMVQEIPKIMNINNVSILDSAAPIANPAPVKPNHIVNGAIGFIASFLVIMTLVLLREYLDDSIKSEQVIEEALGLSVLAVIPRMKKEDVLPAIHVKLEEKVGDRPYVAVNQ